MALTWTDHIRWNDKRIDWVNVGWFGVIHVGALFAPWTFTWTGLWLALGLWWLAGSIGICLTFHRLLTHRGFTLVEAARVPGHAGRAALERRRRDLVGGDAPHAPRELRRPRRRPAHAQGRLRLEPHRLDLHQDRLRLPRDGAALGARARGRPGAPRAEPRPRRAEHPAGHRLLRLGRLPARSSGGCRCGSCSRCTAPGS